MHRNKEFDGGLHEEGLGGVAGRGISKGGINFELRVIRRKDKWRMEFDRKERRSEEHGHENHRRAEHERAEHRRKAWVEGIEGRILV